MKKQRLQISIAVFLMVTVIKMIMPAAAIQIKNELQPVMDRNDHYEHVLHRIERFLRPLDLSNAPPYDPHPPLTGLRNTLNGFVDDPLAVLPKTSDFPKEESEITDVEDPALKFGQDAREAFLETQSLITNALPPDNVSYEVLKLPFEESSPIDGESSSGFGYRMHPIDDVIRFHYGTDFAADMGTEIRAFADGTVLEAGFSEGYGNYIKLDHGNGFVTLYGHCSELWVSEGEIVSRSQAIALVGSTGRSTGPHLHFELIHDGCYLNPEFYLYQ